MKEQVWVIKREFWNKKMAFEGYFKDIGGAYYRYLLEHGEFKNRDEVENDMSYKQIVPQALLVYHDDDDLLLYVNQRLKAQSENRLHYLYSLGVGGHLNPEDNSLEHLDIIQVGLHREITEEVFIPKPYNVEYIGLVNDESAEVSQVHLGVWFKVTIPQKGVSVRETEKMRGFWLSKQELTEEVRNKYDFESWAEIITGNLHQIFIK